MLAGMEGNVTGGVDGDEVLKCVGFVCVSMLKNLSSKLASC